MYKYSTQIAIQHQLHRIIETTTGLAGSSKTAAMQVMAAWHRLSQCAPTEQQHRRNKITPDVKRREKCKDYPDAHEVDLSGNADCNEHFFVLLWAQPCPWKIEKKNGISVLIANSTQWWTEAS